MVNPRLLSNMGTLITEKKIDPISQRNKKISRIEESKGLIVLLQKKIPQYKAFLVFPDKFYKRTKGEHLLSLVYISPHIFLLKYLA